MANDLILELNGKRVKSPDDLQAKLAELSFGAQGDHARVAKQSRRRSSATRGKARTPGGAPAPSSCQILN